MTLEIGSQKVGRIGRRGRGTPMAPSLPIGESDANIVACPACSRPLDTGNRRCPGCGTRLIAGVKASRAVVFIGVGGLAGFALGAGLVALMTTLNAQPAQAVVQPVPPIVAPSQAPVVIAPPPVVDPGIPSSALSALRQTTLINQRVVTDAARLSVALETTKPSSSEIAPILRAMASTATVGQRLAPTVGAWDEAESVSADFVAFYAAIARTADEGLSSSLSSSRAYVAAAQDMLEVVAGLGAIDAASRTLAASADLNLPPLTAP
jgi:hypothetical protein